MGSSDLTRVHYTPRQFLGAVDFSDEQRYHVGMRRRHNISQHTWGIVQGLELVVEDESDLFVQPGFAVDGFGRELVLEQRLGVARSEFDERGADALDVFLAWVREEVRSERDAPLWNKPAADRWRESVAVETKRADLDADYRQTPEGRVEADEEFGPYSPQHDDPARRWTIYLGRFERRRKPDRTYVYKAVLDNRPYAGLVAESVEAPWENGPRLELGAKRDEPADAAGEAHLAVCFQPPAQEGEVAGRAPIFEVRRSGRAILRGETTVVGSLTVDGGAAHFGDVGDEPSARAWGIYRIGRTEYRKAADSEDLRIVMGAGEGLPRRVVIGAWDADKGFHECLTVDPDGTVTVHGDLVVKGEIPAELAVSRVDSVERRALLQNAHFAGVNAGAGGEAGIAFELAMRKLTPNIEQLANTAGEAQSLWQDVLDWLKDIFTPGPPPA